MAVFASLLMLDLAWEMASEKFISIEEVQKRAHRLLVVDFRYTLDYIYVARNRISYLKKIYDRVSL